MKKPEANNLAGLIKVRPEGGDFFNFRPSVLALADGRFFDGASPAWQNQAYYGEVVFNTGMTGYVESLTDPSYAGQILTFTYPLIGNYGVLAESVWESDRIFAAGVVVSEACRKWSHAASYQSLLAWLAEQNVPIITEIDTRSLAKHLRASGTMPGAICLPNKRLGLVFEPPTTPMVSIQQPQIYNPAGSKPVILVDCGAKANICRCLVAMDLRVKRVPHDYDYTDEDFDGVVISNGPGDPTDYQTTIDIAKKALTLNKPLFGICLGSQIMALAAGAKTYKLPYGHRGHNQPCLSPSDNKCYITSQNHGYAIDAASLPKGWEVTFRNLNDNSVEGIAHTTKPFFSVQFHPEASPGPTDTAWLFNQFYASL